MAGQQISARNYAAQAQRGLNEYSQILRRTSDFRIDAAMVESMASSLGNAVHFALPDDGIIFDDDLRGMRGVGLRLPYQSISVEYFVNRKEDYSDLAPHYTPKRVILAQEHTVDDIRRYLASIGVNVDVTAAFGDEGNVVTIFAANEFEGKWIPIIAGWSMPAAWDAIASTKKIESLLEKSKNATSVTIAGKPMILCPTIYERVKEKEGEDMSLRHICHDIGGEVRAVLELCEALTCSNVKTAIHQASDQVKNARRVRDGKLPIYETKMLTIEAPLVSGRGGGGTTVGDRISPRQHLRRGHIRELNSGQRVWVNSCVVGRASTGVIDKSYAVRSRAFDKENASIVGPEVTE